jgi:hypothetical protein
VSREPWEDVEELTASLTAPDSEEWAQARAAKAELMRRLEEEERWAIRRAREAAARRAQPCARCGATDREKYEGGVCGDCLAILAMAQILKEHGSTEPEAVAEALHRNHYTLEYEGDYR